MSRAIVAWALMVTAAAPAAAQQCTLEYQRADNMWAALGRPDGALGKEILALEPGQTRVLNTDWKYEKQRSDGTNYYGSHVRIVTNTGTRQMNLVFRGDVKSILGGALGAVLTQLNNDRARGTLDPGATWKVKADLMEVSCKPADKEARVPAPTGLTARQVSPREIVLTWQRVPDAKEYRVYVNPPQAAHLAGRPGVIGGSGTRWVITLPPSVAPSTVYRASIETVGAGGATSERAEFNPVTVQLASGPGGTPQTGSGPGALPGGTGGAPQAPVAGKSCPPGEFVTGFSSTGNLMCGRP